MRWNELDDSSAISTSSFRRRPEAKPRAAARSTACDDVRVRMPDDQRSPRADVIDVALAIDVPHEGALAALNKKRGAADRRGMRATGELTPPGVRELGTLRKAAGCSSLARLPNKGLNAARGAFHVRRTEERQK